MQSNRYQAEQFVGMGPREALLIVNAMGDSIPLGSPGRPTSQTLTHNSLTQIDEFLLPDGDLWGRSNTVFTAKPLRGGTSLTLAVQYDYAIAYLPPNEMKRLNRELEAGVQNALELTVKKITALASQDLGM